MAVIKMTNFYPTPNVYSGNLAAPAFSPQGQPIAQYPPAPQVSPSQALTTQVSNGDVPLDTQPSNVGVAPGQTSLLAQLATGQMVFNQSTYGQAVPGNTVVTGPASGVTVATPSIYTGA